MFPGSEKLFRRNSTGQKFMETWRRQEAASKSASDPFPTSSKMQKEVRRLERVCECILRFNKTRRRRELARAHTDASIRCKFNRLESSTLTRFSQMGLMRCRRRRQREERKIYATLAERYSGTSKSFRARSQPMWRFIRFLHATLNLSRSARPK